MPRMIYDYTKSRLERASTDPARFVRKLKNAEKVLLPYELEMLKKWLDYYTSQKPELKDFVFAH
ncbi:hypothetical protein [Flavobacterium silvaticum]|uniref:Uncharacterized protein n=1 Tax=Flavobacterium silvaticum TaxID=1852020 RepID=A0A972JEW5_9FLAO|nr:hypothetical protein [Flavobacterium silvaticum]NMH27329.1 hypothetical protein [Flavobacterium silvaticum]